MISSRAEILSVLGLASTASDQDIALVNLLQVDAEILVKRHVGGLVEQQSFTELYPDRGLYTPLDMLIEG